MTRKRTVSKPFWLAVSVDDSDGSKLRSGEPVADVIPLAQKFKPDALLVNCSVPEAVSQALSLISSNRLEDIKLGAYANGFKEISEEFVSGDNAVVDSLEAREDLDPPTYTAFCSEWIQSGAQIVGGCCEVGPKHIKAMSEQFRPT